MLPVFQRCVPPPFPASQRLASTIDNTLSLLPEETFLLWPPSHRHPHTLGSAYWDKQGPDVMRHAPLGPKLGMSRAAAPRGSHLGSLERSVLTSP